jgi:2-polyprenyl-6-methoxyphenol hydroxylase-like FAD-dependent oxidoreductase
VTIVVVGGGIAGIATAIALARRELAVEVLEQAGAAEAAGAGVQIGPNAAHALQAIGAYEAVAARSTEPSGLVIRNGETGATLAAIPFGQRFEARFGAPYRVAHRADLLDALLLTASQIPEITLRYGGRVMAVAANDDGGHTLQLADGSERRVRALIGADGIRSTVRAHLLRDGPPVPSGHRLYRALFDAAALPAAMAGDEVTLDLLPNAHVVTYRVAGGRLVNVVVVIAGDGEGAEWSVPVDRAEVLGGLQRRAAMLDALLTAAPGWTRWTGADRPPAQRWGEGSATLVGDAAHPALPFLAQGAAMALEDAAVLGGLATDAATLAEAFRRYEQQRQARTARLTAAARRQGAIYHQSGGLRLLRDLVLRLAPASLAIRQLDWLYRWKSSADVNAI